MHDDHAWKHCEVGHCRQIACKIVLKPRVERHADCMRHTAYHQRISVGLGLRHKIRADIAAATRTILDNKGLAKTLVKFLPDHASEYVGSATRHEGHDDAHGALRIILCTHRQCD